MKSIFRNVLALCIAALAFTSCSPSMESIVEEANKHCPIKLKGMGKIESLEFENNTLTYNCLVTTRNFNLSAMEGHEEEMKYAFLTMLPNILNSKGNEAITKKLIDDNSSLAFHLYSKGIKNPRLKGPKAADITVTFGPEDLRQVVDGKVDNSPEIKLKSMTALSNLQLPQRIDSETTFAAVVAKDNNVYYTYEVDESRDPETMTQIEANKDQLREFLAQTVKSKDPNIRQVTKLCKEANYGVVYRYVGEKSGKTLEFAFSPSEF